MVIVKKRQNKRKESPIIKIGDFMYYLFIIKKEIYEIYKNKEFSLYKLLFNLYNLNKEDYTYGITLYNQLCDTVNIKKIKQYFELLNKVRIGKNKYYLTENKIAHLIIINPSHITYKTEKISLNILYILNNYSKYIFICNFKENEFFFLKEKI